MGILFRGNSPWEAAGVRSSTVTMTKTSFIYFSGSGRQEAAKEWEKKAIPREVNLAIAFGTTRMPWQPPGRVCMELGVALLAPAFVSLPWTHWEVTLLSRVQVLKPLTKCTGFTAWKAL